MLDVASGRLAVVPAVRTHVGGPPVVAAPIVQIREAPTGKRVRDIPLGGTPTAVALSSTIVAALVKPTSGRTRIERYALATGRLLGATVVAETTAQELDAALGFVVYRSENIISVLDQSGTRHVVARAAGLPVGLSIEGRRVAWGERGGTRGRIQSVTLH
jgi:hypothetical protein